MKKYFLLATGLFILVLTFGSCKKTDQQALIDRQIIENYVADNNLQGAFTPSGLYYVIVAPGDTAHPAVNSTVTVDYKGSFLNGAVFDQNTNVSFALNTVILGWQEGIPLIGTGGEIILIVPSALAYGSTGRGSIIPPNTVLRFDVTLDSFTN
ncbi:MAG: FKBP-type peptidyl-prolyl cis-trans isomerase [Bacteroidales bacterium]|nr:FKBP-type peptidyl-prolyl cis-trans isomerase [Bacteroidales bacterium]